MTPFLVLDSLIHNVNMVPACKLDSRSVFMDCLSSTHLSTSASEMNISSSLSLVSHAPNVAVQQVMNSEAALNSVIIPETWTSQSHFHIVCQLKGRHRTIKVAAMVDSGATSLFIDQKYAKHHQMLHTPLEHPMLRFSLGLVRTTYRLWLRPEIHH